MTNAEKFKTAVERRDAYQEYIRKHWEFKGEFDWLELEAEEELKPCPFCGSEKLHTGCVINNWCVICDDCDCRTNWFSEKSNAIAAWNRRAK